jgi:hypothetical protein
VAQQSWWPSRAVATQNFKRAADKRSPWFCGGLCLTDCRHRRLCDVRDTYIDQPWRLGFSSPVTWVYNVVGKLAPCNDQLHEHSTASGDRACNAGGTCTASRACGHPIPNSACPPAVSVTVNTTMARTVRWLSFVCSSGFPPPATRTAAWCLPACPVP